MSHLARVVGVGHIEQMRVTCLLDEVLFPLNEVTVSNSHSVVVVLERCGCDRNRLRCRGMSLFYHIPERQLLRLCAVPEDYSIVQSRRPPTLSPPSLVVLA